MKAVQDQEGVANEIGAAVRHSAVYGLGAAVAKAIGFLMLPVYTHYLNPIDYGILEILDLSMGLLGMLLNMGMTSAMLRYYNDAKSIEEKRQVISTAFIFVTGSALLLFLMILPFVSYASLLILGPHVPPEYFLLSFSSFILGFIANVSRTYLRAIESSFAFIVLDTVVLFAMLIMNIVFVVFLKVGLVGILLSALVSNLLWMGVSGWLISRVGIRFSLLLARSMAIFGLPLIFSNLAFFSLNYSDRFFLQHLRSLDVVGVYALGYKFAFMLNYLIVQTFNAMWQARMFLIYAKPDHPKIFGQIFVLYSLILIYCGLTLSIFSPEIVRVMVGPSFAASQQVIPIVALAYVFCGISNYMQVGMLIAKKTNVIGYISVGTAALSLALNYFLILHFGMLGAAWATMIGFFAMSAGSYWFSQRLLPLPLGAPRVTVVLLLAVCAYWLSTFLNAKLIGVALTEKSALLALFTLAIWKSPILSPSEIETLKSGRDHALSAMSRFLPWESSKAVSL